MQNQYDILDHYNLDEMSHHDEAPVKFDNKVLEKAVGDVNAGILLDESDKTHQEWFAESITDRYMDNSDKRSEEHHEIELKTHVEPVRANIPNAAQVSAFLRGADIPSKQDLYRIMFPGENEIWDTRKLLAKNAERYYQELL